MNSLFFRIWVANWLVFLLMIALSVWTINRLHTWKARTSVQHFQTQLLQIKSTLLAEESAATKVNKKEENPAIWVARHSSKDQFLLLDNRGQDVLQRPLPRRVLRRMPTAPLIQELPENRSPGARVHENDFPAQEHSPFQRHFSTNVEFQTHPTHLLIMIPTPPRAMFLFFSPLLLIFFAFLGSGLAAMGLARYISNPIKQLLLASKKISRGEFKSNVAASVGNRKDEIADLARRFDEMTFALEQAKIHQDSLLRDVSHELRSPLTRLTLIFDLLNEADETERDKLHNRLKKELQSLEILINEVMSLAHFKTEAESLKFAEQDLVAVLSPVVDDAQFEANALNKTVLFEHQNTGHAAQISTLHFCRAIENILRNAIRHTPEHGKVRLTLSRQNELWLMCISDEGPGVNEDELQDIFRPFYRSRDAEHNHKGNGIGLALAQSIIQAHRGNMFASNGVMEKAELSETLPKSRKGLHVYIQIPVASRNEIA